MDTHELAWASGFFDGEGCFSLSVSSTGRRYPSASIAQVDRRALARFRRTVRVGKIYGPYKKKRPNQAPEHKYAATGLLQTQAVLAMLWRFMGPVKRAQGIAVLKAFLAQPADARKWLSRGNRCRAGHNMADPLNRLRSADGRTRCRPCRRAREREHCRRRYRLAHGIPLDAPLQGGRPISK